MSMIINDPKLAADLAAVSVPTELRGPDGAVLGRYVPKVDGMMFPELGITDEEIYARRRSESGWVSSDEVEALFERLRNGR